MFNVNNLPALEMEIGVIGSEVQDSTVGGVCVAVGIALGIAIREAA